MSDIKAELRLMREQRPDEWDKIVNGFCPSAYDDSLFDAYFDAPYVCDGGVICENEEYKCEQCWNRAMYV